MLQNEIATATTKISEERKAALWLRKPSFTLLRQF
jgi:hypothetical protein